MNDNVMPFPGAEPLPENDLQIAPRPYSGCAHHSVVLDEHTRMVQCADPKCGATIDPFNFLLTNARTIQRAWLAHAEVTRKANEVSGRVNLMLKEEQRLRSMIKRLQDKSGAVLTVRDIKAL